MLQALPTALPPPRERRTDAPSLQRLARLSDEAVDDIIDGNETGFDAGKRPPRFGDDAVHDLFALALRRGSAAEAETAAGAVASRPAAVTPDRTLPAALGRLHAEEGAAGSGAFALLWRHAAGFLLARSARPPEEPSDWVISANVGCGCEHCRRLRDFCKDPAARTARFPLRKELRAHLHQTIGPPAGWTSSTSPSAAAGRSPSCAPRRARPTGGGWPSTRRTSRACGG